MYMLCYEVPVMFIVITVIFIPFVIVLMADSPFIISASTGKMVIVIVICV